MSSLLKCAASAVLPPSVAAARSFVARSSASSVAFLSHAQDVTFSKEVRSSHANTNILRSSSSMAPAAAAIIDTASVFSPQQQASAMLLYAAKRNQATRQDGGSALSRTEIRRMRVADLREELGRRGLSSSGLREALVARLLDASSSLPAGSLSDGILESMSATPTDNNRASNLRTSSSTPRKRNMSATATSHSDNAQDVVKEQSQIKDQSETNVLSPEKTYVLRFDGGSRGNPGVAGSGMVLYDADDRTEVWSGYHYLGDHHTNNEAEYTGILEGLRCAYGLGARTVVVQGDSQLIVRQLEGKYRVKSEKLRPYYQKVMKELAKFDGYHVCHIERAENARADELANAAMDTRQSSMEL